jgi:hypothetical protein
VSAGSAIVGRTRITERANDASADPDRPTSARSILLSSERLGAIARLDLLEADGLMATPVDYKRGTVPDTPHRARDHGRVQLRLQGLILLENGDETTAGALYFAGSRTRAEVPFEDELIAFPQRAMTSSSPCSTGR